MALDDIFQVTIKQKVNGNDAVNVWYCQATEATATAQDIADAVVDRSIPTLAAILPGNVEFVEVIARNLFNTVDQWVESVSITGDLADNLQILPLHNAIGCTLNHDNPGIRKGAKRMAGVNESLVGEYGIMSASALSTWDTAMNDFVDNQVSREVSPGVGEELAQWVIVKTIIEVVDGVTGYRLPESLVEAVVGVITSVVVNPGVTSQLSRKQGVGT